MESSWITRREIRTQTNPYLVTDTIRVVWSGTSPDIPRYPQISPACTHSLLMRCLPTECSLASSPWRLMNGEILSLGTFLSWK